MAVIYLSIDFSCKYILINFSSNWKFNWNSKFIKFCFSNIQGTESIEGHNLNITKRWQAPISECAADSIAKQRARGGGETAANNERRRGSSYPATDFGVQSDPPHNKNGAAVNVDDDDVNQNIIEGAARSKVSRSSTATETMGLSGAAKRATIQLPTAAIFGLTLMVLQMVL